MEFKKILKDCVKTNNSGDLSNCYSSKLLTKDRKGVIQDQEERYGTYILSESSLKKDWLKPEEDEAWEDL